MGKRKVCPRCGSADVARLPDNGISPHPGYECKGCGQAMRAPGTAVAYAIVLVISLAIAFGFMLAWFSADGGPVKVVLPIVGLVVAGYCVYQLTRPAPKLVEGNPAAPAAVEPPKPAEPGAAADRGPGSKS